MAKRDYPYSALFDYDQIALEEEQKKQRLQESQKKIMRTNAIGDAFRLLVDAAGGSKGATITPRPVNPGILKASGRFNALEDQSQTNMERFRLQDLAMREKDMSYGLGLKAQEQKDIEDATKLKEQQTFTAGENKLNRENQTLNNTEERTARASLQESQAKSAKELERIRSSGDINEIARRYQGEMDKIQTKQKLAGTLAQKGLFQVARYDDPSTDAIVSRNQVVSLFPALKEWLTTQGIHPYQMPRVLQPDVAPTKIQDDQLKILISQFPEFFKTRLPELSGGESVITGQQPIIGNSSLFPGGWQQKPTYQQGYGPLKSYGGPVQPVNPVAFPTVKPDKSGNSDLSIYFN